MGDPIKAQKTAKHFAAAVSATLAATPFGKRSVPAAPAVRFHQSMDVAAHTYGNDDQLFLLRSTAIDGSKRFKPAECLASNPVEGSFATCHGHMGTIYFPKGSCPGAINCGVLPGPNADCAAEIAGLLDALAERLLSEFQNSPTGFLSDFGKGASTIKDLLADQAGGVWDSIKSGAGAVGDYIGNNSIGQMAADAAKGAQGAYEGAVGAATDLMQLADDLSQLSADEIKTLLKEWLQEAMSGLACDARDLLAQMLADPKPMAEQLGEMKAAAEAALVETAAVVLVTRGVGSAGKIGSALGKAGSKIGALGDKIKDTLKRKKEGSSPSKTPNSPDPKHDTPPKAPEETKRDANKGSANGEAQPPCQSCPTTTHPVNPIFGTKILEDERDLDFTLDGLLPLAWQRTYVSGNPDSGWLGQGWSVPISFRLDIEDEALLFIDTQGRRTRFPHLAVGESFFSPFEHTTLKRQLRNEYLLTGEDGLMLVFGLAGADIAQLAGRDAAEAREREREASEQARLAAELGNEPANAPAAESTPAPDRRLPQADTLVLLAIADRNRNNLRLHYRADGLPDTLESSCGRQIGFIFDPQFPAPRARLARVIEFIGEPRANGRYPPAQAPTLIAYRYSPEGDLIAVEDGAQRTVRRFAYRQHLMTEHSEPGGVTARYAWDTHTPKGRVLRNTLSTGEHWEFAYDEPARVTRVTDHTGRSTHYHYDEEKRFTGITDALGARSTRELDIHGNLIALTEAGGRSTRYRYDAAGRLLRAEAPDGSVTTYAYTGTSRQPTRSTDPLGQSTAYEYDERGNLTAVAAPDGAITRYRHDARGQLIALTDAGGNTHTFEYAAGRLTARTDCSGHTHRYRHDERGNLITETDPLGQSTHYTWQILNRQDRLTGIRHADGSEERIAHDPLGRPIAHRDPLGRITRYTLDPAGRPLTRQDPLGHTLHYRYDRQGRLSELINENGARARFAYDPLDRLLAEQGFDGLRNTYRYNVHGELEEHRQSAPGQAALITRYQRDAAGRLTEKLACKPAVPAHGTPPTRSRNRFAWDAKGQLIEARNQTARIRLHYNAAGQLLREVTQSRWQRGGAAPTILRHRYDLLGNRIATILPDGRTLNTLRYGSGHAHQIDLDGQTLADIERDALHREISRSQGELISDYRLDPQGRLLESRSRARTVPGIGQGASGSAAPGHTPPRHRSAIVRQYRYDLAGQLLGIDDPRQGATHYRYDPLGRLLAAQTTAYTEHFAFDPAHNLIEAQSEPRPAHAPKRLSEAEWAALVKANIGNPKFNPLQSDPTDGNAEWDIEQTNRLKVWQEHRYRYDAWGNCIEKRSGQRRIQRFVWDAEHQLCEARSGSGSGSGSGTREEHWGYAYDPFGRRIAKYRLDKKQRPVPESRSDFLWDGNRLLGERQGSRQSVIVYEPESFIPLALLRWREGEEEGEAGGGRGNGGSHGEKAGEGALDALPELPTGFPLDWADLPERSPQAWRNVVAMRRKSAAQLGQGGAGSAGGHGKHPRPEAEVLYFHTDHLGTPRELTDREGRIVWSARYRAWGATLAIEQPLLPELRQVGNAVQETWQEQIDPVVQNLRFQGQYFDAETGLHYNRFRYYDPDCGRFVSQDPIGLEGGVNLYQYAANPVGWVDPLGLMARSNGARAGGAKSKYKSKLSDCERCKLMSERKCDEYYDDFHQAQNRALEITGLPTKGTVSNIDKFGGGVSNGRRMANENRGYRVEHDGGPQPGDAAGTVRHGAHINTFDGKKPGKTICFEASPETVKKINRRF